MSLPGDARQDEGASDDPVSQYRRAVAANPTNAGAHVSLGDALRDANRLDEAAHSYRQAIALEPAKASAHHGLGTALLFIGNYEEAAASYREALARESTNPETHYYLGIAHQLQDDLDQAIACFRKSLALRPDNAAAHNNLGTAFLLKKEFGAAAASYRDAVALDDTLIVAHFNLGVALNNQGKAGEALAHFQRASTLTPDTAEAQHDMADELRAEGVHQEAMTCYERALALRPDFHAALCGYVNSANSACLWEPARHRREQLLAKSAQPDFDGAPRPLIAISDDPALFLRAARHYRNNNIPFLSSVSVQPRLQREKIRLAYLSEEFHESAAAYLTAELFELHDRSQFELHAVSFGPNDLSPMRRRLIDAFDHFVDARYLSDGQVADVIRKADIDIVVALMNIRKHGREAVLAHRAAPIQVNYLVYPGTFAAEFMDYMIVDPFVAPAAHQRFYAERLVHLPECYQVNDRKRAIAAGTPARAECGLPEDGFVFCSFNNNYKITPDVFGVWMRLLAGLPGSVLWLLGDNGLAENNLRREAQARGVAASRLIFAPRVGLPDHLARHRLADLFVDTFPCNAHTTASDALWAGLPVLTCAGQTFAARVAGSLLSAIGLRDLITHSLEEYEALALRLATSPAQLAAIRARLRENRLTAPLFDTDRTRRHLEAAYRTMWDRWRAGLAPEAFSVPAATRRDEARDP